MKLKIHLFCLVVVLLMGCKNTSLAPTTSSNELTRFEYPPEWEPHQAVWIDIYDNLFGSEGKIAVRLEVVKALHKHVPIKILTTTDSLKRNITSKLLAIEVDTSKVTFIQHPLPNNYMRDTGPIFLSDGKTLQIANWNWKCLNDWCDDISKLRATVDDSLAKRYNYSLKDSKINLEGGGIDVNSYAAIALKDYVLEQNEHKISLEEIENEILRLYGKEQMIWLEGIPLLERNGLKTANYFGQGADGHVDALVRFVNDSTLLVSAISEEDRNKTPIQAHDYTIFQGYYEQLSKLRQPNGRPYNLVKIPVADLSLHTVTMNYGAVADYLNQYGLRDQFADTDTIQMVPTLSYANFLITNGVVVVSEYWEEGLPESEKEKDRQMKHILQTYFPDREVIGIQTKTINWDGGGIHCTTQQEPKIQTR